MEAFAGSAIQLQWLDQSIAPLPADAAAVLLHVINPYGMSWLRRANENNVDLNRNFLGPDEPYRGAPDAYRKLEAFINPATLSGLDGFYLRMAWLAARHGMPALRQAFAGGQYEYPKGLMFGGAQLEQGPALLQSYLAEHVAAADRIVVIDIHTGLGTFAEDRLLLDASPDKRAVNDKMRVAFGERVQLLDASGIAYRVRGASYEMYDRLCPRSEICFAGQEFGTYHAFRVGAALRAENRWHHFGGGGIDHPSKRRLAAIFNPPSDVWRRSVLHRGRQVIDQALSLAFDFAG